MPRLPIPGSDEGNWGRILNDYLLTTHAEDGTLKPGTITSASLSAGAITTTALADGIVSEAKLDATVRTKLNSTSGTSVAGLLGQPNGIATLDASGKVPASQLPTGSGGTTPDATANSKGSIQLTGDLGGSATSPRVMGLNGITVSGTPTPGQVLTASSSSTAAWSTNAQTGGMLWTSSTAPTTQEGAADGDLWTDAATDPVHLRVRVNGQWVSLASVPKPSGGTINPAPGTPNGTPSDTSIILNWTAPANPGGTVSGYNVYDAQGTKLNSTPLTATSYTVTGLTAGTSYSFTIRSIVNGTEASQGATVSVTTTGGGGGTTVPTAPTNVTATAGDGQASVTFTPVSGATSYTVTASSGQTQTGTSSPITVTGLTNGTAVTFTVTASNSAGTSPASAASGAVTPEGGGGGQAAPTDVYAVGEDGRAIVSFTASPGATQYEVTASTGQKATGIESPINVTGLANGIPVTFTVIATGAAGTSASSIPSYAMTPVGANGNTIKINHPVYLTAASTNTSITLNWTAPANPTGIITGYNVYQAGIKVTPQPITTTTYTAENLAPYTDYNFTVKTVVNHAEAAGYGNWLRARTTTGLNGGVANGATQTVVPVALPLANGEIANPFRGQYVMWDVAANPAGVHAVDRYARYTWGQVNPSQGTYDFGYIETMMATAQANGGRAGFRIMPVWAGQGNILPADVAANANCWINYNNDTIPDWNSDYYLTRWEGLWAEIGQRYANNPSLGFVDVGGMGCWGEWHNWPYHDQYPRPAGVGGQTEVAFASAQRIIKAVVDALPNAFIFLNTISGLDDPSDAVTGRSAEYGAKIMTWAFSYSPRVGIRNDAWGGGIVQQSAIDGLSAAHQYAITHNYPETQQALNRWKVAPLITEWANDFTAGSADGNFIKGDAQVSYYHMSLLGSSNFQGPVSNYGSAEQTAFIHANHSAGYRYKVDSVILPQTVASGNAMTIAVTWSNQNVAPTYEQWNVTYQVKGAATVTQSSTLDMRLILPGAPVQDMVDIATGALAPGTYTLFVTIRDTASYYPDPMNLAQEGRQSDGSYQLATFTVQ
jgi:hypothetical protein